MLQKNEKKLSFCGAPFCGGPVRPNMLNTPKSACVPYANSSVVLLPVKLGVQLPTSAVSVTLLAFAAERRAASPLLLDVRRCLLPARRSAANPPHSAPAVTRWDRQTDGRMLVRFKDPAPHIMRARSKSASLSSVRVLIHKTFTLQTITLA